MPLTEYDIGAAFKAIEDELIASMIRNMDRHRAEETKEGIEWSMWQAEQLKALETVSYTHLGVIQIHVKSSGIAQKAAHPGCG